jgi:chromosome segregation ATPase
MSPASSTPAAVAFQAQLDALGERMDRNFEEIKAMMRSFDERVRAVETREAGCQPVIQARIDAAWRKLDEHDTSLRVLEKQLSEQTKNLNGVIEQQRSLYAILRWGVGILTALLTVTLGMFITGQAAIIFK